MKLLRSNSLRDGCFALGFLKRQKSPALRYRSEPEENRQGLSSQSIGPCQNVLLQ
jgi:hypothetical protein